ncbi:hypothetical protein [Metabacillus iocasae]|uniref:Membrane protein YfcA n=1 Tax=Priestia iocasae TaxID=2291674 RepID=A0ABS2QTC6_9BACI|nr:hypothetical protein [Metabacillus iocasae]MBM7702720.1 putative membrane protein YfcA [Metabacillus iocasae]
MKRLDKWKYILLIGAIVGQLVGVAFLFINMKAAIVFYIVYVLTLIGLACLFIWERRKEKEEEDNRDYRDY